MSITNSQLLQITAVLLEILTGFFQELGLGGLFSCPTFGIPHIFPGLPQHCLLHFPLWILSCAEQFSLNLRKLHVKFSFSCGCCCVGNPAYTWEQKAARSPHQSSDPDFLPCPELVAQLVFPHSWQDFPPRRQCFRYSAPSMVSS
jgi:hypothetical protein